MNDEFTLEFACSGVDTWPYLNFAVFLDMLWGQLLDLRATFCNNSFCYATLYVLQWRNCGVDYCICSLASYIGLDNLDSQITLQTASKFLLVAKFCFNLDFIEILLKDLLLRLWLLDYLFRFF